MELADELIIKHTDLTVQDELGREQASHRRRDLREQRGVVHAEAAHTRRTRGPSL
jgi:hypothetical protein